MKKKFLGLSFIFCLLFVFATFGICSTSYAAPALLDLVSDLRILENKAGIGSNIADTLISTSGSIGWRNDIKNCFNNSNFKGYAILFSGNNLYILCSGSNEIVNSSNNPSNTGYNRWNYGSGGGGFQFNKTTGAYVTTGSFTYNSFTLDYVLTNDISINTRNLVLGVDEEYGANYIYPVFDFTQNGDVHNVTVGNYSDVSVIYYNPTTPIFWGILQNYNEIDSNLLSYSLDIMTPDGNDEVLFDYVQWRLIDYGRYYWLTDSSKIYLNRVYKLLVNYDGSELVYTYYIAPYGSNYSTGDTIGYFYNSGDSSFDTQDATNTIVDALTDTEQVDVTLDSLTSGEIYNKLGYTEYHTSWNNFMYDMFTGIETALFSSGDIAFTFPYMRTTITLHSSDFTTPPGLLKGFCSTFLMFGFIVLVYQHIARFYHRLQEGAVNQVVEEFNVDDETLIL